MEPKEKIKIGKTGNVTLCLRDKDYKPKRNLGQIKDRIFYTVRKDNQLFQKSNSFGINYKFLNEFGKYFDSICIEYYGKYYFTSRDYFLHFGRFLYFKDNRLDKQIFLPLSEFGKDKADKFDIEQVQILKNKLKNFGQSFGSLSVIGKTKTQENLF